MRFKIRKDCLLKTKLKKCERDVVIPASVVSIGDYCFSNSSSIESVQLPNSIKRIGESAFYNCSKLKNINIPSSITNIEDNAFDCCYFIENIELPKSLKHIGDRAFSRCVSLENINIPPSIDKINYGTFMSCKNLKEVYLPFHLSSIESFAFEDCYNLEKINIPDTVTKIGKNAFYNCSKLEKIHFPITLEYIGEYAFSSCFSVKKVVIPPLIKIINNNTFSNCKKLEKVILPNSLEHIEHDAFYRCKNLKKIKLPISLKSIGKSAFEGCSSIEEIEIPSLVKEISYDAFARCKNLKIIKFNEGLERICDFSFINCSSLEEIEIPSTVQNIGNAFYECDNIKKIKLKNIFNVLDTGISNLIDNFDYIYFNRNNNELIISTYEIDSLDGYENICYVDNKYSGKSIAIFTEIMFGKEKINRYRNLQPILPLIVDYTKFDTKEFFKTFENVKEFNVLIKQLLKNHDINLYDADYFELFKLVYSIGIFSDNQVDRQRASEFICNAFEKGKISYNSFHSMFESLKFKEFNKEWAEFFMNKNNFDQLLELEVSKQHGFIARVCNSFEQIREFGRSNRGNQHYKKVTIEMCKEYFSNVEFEGVSDTNKDIVEEILHYTHSQESFEKAKRIRNEYLILKEQGKIKDHLLNEEMKEDIFSNIDNERKRIVKGIKGILFNLNETSNNKFSYEFLSKYDPKNFVLGKYCCCCAHLEGAGSGIMKASILHPDCQNLVIRDKDGVIVAKSTLYVNRKQGYGLFNNVEVNTNLNDNDKKLIYKKYIEAVKTFAAKYNQINKDIPLTKINVGMNLNDLYKYIEKFNTEEDVLLPGLDFKMFDGTWSGDWHNEQYVLWRYDDKNQKILM